jgi:hypothetical protein
MLHTTLHRGEEREMVVVQVSIFQIETVTGFVA